MSFFSSSLLVHSRSSKPLSEKDHDDLPFNVDFCWQGPWWKPGRFWTCNKEPSPCLCCVRRAPQPPPPILQWNNQQMTCTLLQEIQHSLHFTQQFIWYTSDLDNEPRRVITNNTMPSQLIWHSAFYSLSLFRPSTTSYTLKSQMQLKFLIFIIYFQAKAHLIFFNSYLFILVAVFMREFFT